MEQIDFLAIGDIVTEPFIRLQEASVHCTIDTDKCEICMRWGDKIPYEKAILLPAVGNASNAAVSAARLGLRSALRAYVGDDQYGPECLEVLAKEGVDTTYMVTEAGKKTNYHYVLWYETERTILVKHEEYTYTVPEVAVAPKWVYLSSLAANSEQYHIALMEWLARTPETKLAFQPGTFQMKLKPEVLKPIYERSELFFCNKEEAGRMLGTEDLSNIPALLDGMRLLGPQIVVITVDRKGAYASDGTKYWYIPMYPDSRAPFERTGAGDSFASSVTAALALGKPLEEALLWGPVNAMSVVQEVGAQKGLLTRAQLEDYLAKAPADYVLQTLTH